MIAKRFLAFLLAGIFFSFSLVSPLYAFAPAAGVAARAVVSHAGAAEAAIARMIASGKFRFALTDLTTTPRTVAQQILTSAGGASNTSWLSAFSRFGSFLSLAGAATVVVDGISGEWDGFSQLKLSGPGMNRTTSSTFDAMPSAYSGVVVRPGEYTYYRTSSTNSTLRMFVSAVFETEAPTVSGLSTVSLSECVNVDGNGSPMIVAGKYSCSTNSSQRWINRYEISRVTNCIQGVDPSCSLYKRQQTILLEWTNAPVPPPEYAPSFKTVDLALADVPEFSLEKEVSPQLELKISDDLLRRTILANPHLDWSEQVQVLPEDLALAKSLAGISGQAKLRDFINRIGVDELPWPAPGVDSPTVPVNPPSTSNPELPDFDDPGVNAPDLQTPSESSILDPIANLLPDWRNASLTPQNAPCPPFQFDFFGNPIHSVSHCIFIENVRSQINVLALLVWTFTAAVIVLRA